MPKESLKKFCSLHKFLEQHEPDLYEAFENVCLLSLLRPKFGNGVTLLVPPAAEKKKLLDMVYSDDPDQAIPILQSIVIFNYLPNSASWQSAAQTERGVVSAGRQKLEVNISGGDIVVADAKITPNKAFISFPERKNMSVWNITSGKLPLEGQAVALKSPTKKTKARSSYSGAGEGDMCRNYLAKIVEDDAEACIRSGQECLAYLKITNSLVIHLLTMHAEKIEKLSGRMHRCPMITFYNLIEPHIKDPTYTYFIETQAIEDFYNATNKTGVLLETYFTNTTHFDVYKGFYGANASKNTTPEMIRAMCQKKKELLSQFCNKVQLAKNALAAYNGDYVQAFLDDRAFLLTSAYLNMHEIANVQEKLTFFRAKILYMVRHLMEKPPTSATDAKAFICLNQNLSNASDVVSWVCTTLAFVRTSTFGLHIPEKYLDMPELGETTITAENSTKLTPINLEKAIHEHLKMKYEKPTTGGSDIDYSATIAQILSSSTSA